MSVAVVTLEGNVGNVEVKEYGGKECLKFSVAVAQWSKAGDLPPDWYNCTVWSPNAFLKGLRKGTRVVVVGEISQYKQEGAIKGLNVKTYIVNPIINKDIPKSTPDEPAQEIDNPLPF